ncbi:FAD-binding oxidoreductase, partial [Candidatus Micrarchaeota archaeon]|nr:FAD-binding oxidoreductase [Candidatus Micrarchaeota archaeon]
MAIYAQLKQNIETDVLVVGSGIAGLSAAYHLEKAGFDVAVLEEYEVASGATQYSSGILYFGSGTDFQTAINLWGVENAGLFLNESKTAIDNVVALIKKNNWQVGLRWPGSVIVARDARESAYLEVEARAMEALGFAGQLLSSEGVSDIYNGCRFESGLFQPMCYQAKPSQLALALASSLSSNIYQYTPMLSIDEKPGSVCVKTPEAEVNARQVVIATNLKPTFGLEKFFFQESSVLLPSHPLGAELKSFWPKDVIIWTPDERYDLL